MWIFIILVLVILVGLLYTFRLISPGKLEPLKDTNGAQIAHSINEKVKLTIGGVEQGVFILGEKKENPVLLFLHGGPGSPELPLVFTNDGSPRIEAEFVVCYWDQRGAGMSLTGVSAETMSLEQLIADTVEITNYLKNRFKQEKIYIMGHSWGTFLGLKVIHQYPDNYIAYIGMGQLSNQKQSEKLAFDYMKKHAHEINDKKALKGLAKYDTKSADFPEISYIQSIRSSLMNKYGIGLTHNNFTMATVLKQLLFFKGYTGTDKINYLRGILFSQKNLFHYVLEENLMRTTLSFDVPIYIIHGKYDYQVSYKLAKEYATRINSPETTFIPFEESAHSPIIEERENFVKTLKSIKQKY